jgi:transposase
MKKMFEYDLVRRLHYRKGLSRHEISRRTHRKTINKMLRYSRPPGYQLNQPRAQPKLGPFLVVIDQILTDDRQALPKQWHTTKRIFDRLREEFGFTGSYTIIKDYVRQKWTRMREVFFPLEQCTIGHIGNTSNRGHR